MLKRIKNALILTLIYFIIAATGRRLENLSACHRACAICAMAGQCNPDLGHKPADRAGRNARLAWRAAAYSVPKMRSPASPRPGRM